MDLAALAYTVLLGGGLFLLALGSVEGYQQIVRGVRSWRVGRDLTAVQRAREKELREWTAGW